MTAEARARLTAVPLGTRVVIRLRTADGFTDVLGYLRSIDRDRCVIDTRSGPKGVALADVFLAKPVPEPPVRKPRG